MSAPPGSCRSLNILPVLWLPARLCAEILAGLPASGPPEPEGRARAQAPGTRSREHPERSKAPWLPPCQDSIRARTPAETTCVTGAGANDSCEESPSRWETLACTPTAWHALGMPGPLHGPAWRHDDGQPGPVIVSSSLDQASLRLHELPYLQKVLPRRRLRIQAPPRHLDPLASRHVLRQALRVLPLLRVAAPTCAREVLWAVGDDRA